MRVRLILLIVSLLQAVVAVAVIVHSTDETWRDYQLEYYHQAMGRASSPAVKAAIERSGLEIKQEFLVGFGEETRTDRCRTCHMAIEDPNFADGAEPLRSHPPIPEHPFAEFGCTICHEGNGRALTEDYAHGKDEFWPEPLLRGPYIEAACARCHPEPYLEEMPHIRRGRELFDKYACGGCHTLRLISRGKLGPDLTDVGDRFGIPYLDESIRVPKANMPTSIMPLLQVPEQDRIDLVVFLKSQRGRTLVEDPVTLRVTSKQWKEVTPPEVAVSVEAGKDAVARRSCVACHKLGPLDGGIAPDLSYIGRLRNRDYITVHLTDPRAHNTGSPMPSFWMSQSERDAIASYLGTLTDLTIPLSPADQYKLLCSRCHGAEGKGDGVIAEVLLPRPRQFTNRQYFSWLSKGRAIRAIRDGVPGTAMPPFGALLDSTGQEAIFRYVVSTFLADSLRPPTGIRQVPDSNPQVYTESSVASGAAIFALRCYGCHGRMGNGKGPNAPDMLPRPRDLTSAPFFEPISDKRIFESITFGVVGTGMPPWDFLPETQRWDLVNYVRSLSNTGAAAVRHEGERSARQ